MMIVYHEKEKTMSDDFDYGEYEMIKTSELSEIEKKATGYYASAQELLNEIHDCYGYTDTDVANILKVSREHVSRLRHGSKTASPALKSVIREIWQNICAYDTPLTEAEKKRMVPDSSSSRSGGQDGFVINVSVPFLISSGLGVLIALFVMMSVHSQEKANKARREFQV